MPKHADLIYDVGFHHGEDTAFYLKKGFRVVAFEANTRLAEKGREQFAEASRAGRFTMVEGAIIDPERWNTGIRTATFYVNQAWDTWGTTDRSWADRCADRGATSQEVTVVAVDFVGCLNTHGVPHFMKIDIEGADRFCLEALRHVDERPDYVSIESEGYDAGRVPQELDLFEALGYGRFQIVQQSLVPWQCVPKPSREGKDCEHRFALDASGLFGADLPVDGWIDRAAVADVYETICRRQRTFGDGSLLRSVPGMSAVLWRIERSFGVPLPGWYDTHARLGVSGRG